MATKSAQTEKRSSSKRKSNSNSSKRKSISTSYQSKNATKATSVADKIITNVVAPMLNPFTSAVVSSSSVKSRLDAIGCLLNGNDDEQFPEVGELDLRRKAQIVRGGASDHGGQVVVVQNADFDINKTIFGGIEGAHIFARMPWCVTTCQFRTVWKNSEGVCTLTVGYLWIRFVP
jgi:hypothetical protein